MPKQPTRKTAVLAEAISSAQQSAALESLPTKKARARGGRIMYIECKAEALTGEGRIGRVTFSQTGRTLYYHGQKFQSLKGAGLNPISTTWTRAKITGFPDRSAMAVMPCTAVARRSR